MRTPTFRLESPCSTRDQGRDVNQRVATFQRSERGISVGRLSPDSPIWIWPPNLDATSSSSRDADRPPMSACRTGLQSAVVNLNNLANARAAAVLDRLARFETHPHPAPQSRRT